MKRYLLLLALMVLLPASLLAQASSKSLEQIAREQQIIKDRLEHILKKMDRLTRKNELEGRQHTADLIRRANGELKNREIIKRIEDLDAKIRASQLTVDEEQTALLKDLEDIFAILQDRSDLERLQDIIEAFTEGLRGMERLKDEQDLLLEETRRLVYDEEALLALTRKKVSEILEEQKALNARVEEEAAKASDDEAGWSLADRLDDLAEAEERIEAKSSAPPENAGQPKSSDLAKEQDALSGELKKVREEIGRAASGEGDRPPPDPALKEALERGDEKAAQAAEAMEEASKALKEDRPASAGELAGDAAKKLREASNEIRRAGESAYREQRKRNRDLSGRQDHLRQKMNEVGEKLQKLKSLEDKPPSEEGESSAAESRAADSAEAIRREMESARDRLGEGKPAAAKPHQSEALKGLEELEKQLKEQKPSDPSSRNTPSQEERNEKFQDLAERQKALEEQARDLMRRLRELPDQKPVGDLANAADNMSGAAEELGAQQGEEAEVDEEEARKHLEKALKKMKQEENKYQNIRQQEVLFRVQQALEDLKAEQDEINKDTLEFDLALGEDRSLSRLQRKNIRKLAEREQEVKGKATDIREKIEEDNATVFSWILEKNEEDLDEAIGSLQRRDSGPLVQAIQADISERFGELIEALKLEMKRRMEALSEAESKDSENQDGEQNPPERNPLIPPVAELLMIKKMEENAMRRLDDFARLHPDIMEGKAGPLELEMLERLGHQHSSITELFNRMLERSGLNAGPPGLPGEEK